MKKCFFLLMTIIITIYAQPTQNFGKYYDGEIIQVLEHENGYYLVSREHEFGNTNYYWLNLIKTDWGGNTLWKINPKLATFKKGHIPAILTRDKKILIAGSEIETTIYGSQFRAKYARFSGDGSEDWNIVVDYGPSYASGVVQTTEGDYLGVAQENLYDLELIKIREDGTINWIRYLTPSGSNRTDHAQIIQLTDSTYVVRSEIRLKCVDREANIYWEVPIEENSTLLRILRDDFGDLLILSKVEEEAKYLTKVNKNGIQIWRRRINQNDLNKSSTIGLTIDGNYYVTDGNKIVTISTLGYQSGFNELDTDKTINFISRGSFRDVLITLSPDAIFNGIFSRTDESFYFEAIHAYSYSAGTYNQQMSMNVAWSTYHVDYVDILYSTDLGNNWETVFESLVSSPQKISLYTNIEPDTLLLKVQNSYNPSTYDIIKKIIAPYQKYNWFEYIAANEVKMWISNNGDGSHSPITDGSGFFWPGGEDASIPAIFEEGLLYGCKLNGNITVNGNTHRQGLIPGKILPDGLPDDPTKPEYKIFKYKKGWEKLPEGEERDKYEYNVQNWPVSLGAPFMDRDLDGQYNPEVDEPGNGADEYLFNVSNGGDSTVSHFTYGSPPIPLELQISVYGYDRDDELKNVVFKKYKVINKGEEPLTDFYISYWADDDLGAAWDDFVGCDTTLNMAYTFNGDENDENGYGSPPPAVAHMYLQGPVVPGEKTDSAYFNDEWKKGYRNLPMTSFVLFIGPDAIYRDPQQGVYDGTLEVYRLMQGNTWNGSPLVNPNTGETTQFALSGDPVAGIGWYEGDGWPNGPRVGNDHRYLMTSGPFNLAVQDTQEVVLAIFMAQGTDRLNSVAELKKTARIINEFYYDELTDVKEEETLPDKIELSQNYPNPFNPSTKIKFSIPVVETTRRVVSTKLVVYDILGREIKTLLNKKLTPGRYEVEFNGENLSSGVYLYRLQVGDTHIVKKMMLLK